MVAALRAWQSMTVAEFRDWTDGTDTRYDLVAGEPVMQAAAAPEHSLIQGNLTTLLNNALAGRPPCRVLPEAGINRSLRHHTQRTADVVVTCQPPVRGALIEPTVVIEILSPSNRAETLAKLPFYGQFDGIAEIVLVESEQAGVRVHRRSAGPDWLDAPAEEFGPGDVLALRSIDVELRVDDVYRYVPMSSHPVP